ncbi:MAG: hypothetical protein EBQ85_05985 [Proteobacteria bacterium]|nr:hypothetical protein [Pseudomonadota bacterium]
MALLIYKALPKNRIKQAIEQVVQIHGMREFARLAQMAVGEPCSDPEVVPTLIEFSKRAHNDLNRNARQIWAYLMSVPTRSFRAVAGDVNNMLSRNSGFLISFALSQVDLRFQTDPLINKAIYMHRPFVVWSRLILDWITQVIRLSSENSKLTAQDKKAIGILLTSLGELKKGFEQGVYRKEFVLKFFRSVKVFNKHGAISLKVDPSFFAWLEMQLEILQKSKASF